MTKGLITAALMISSVYGPAQAHTSTSAVMLADNSIVSTNSVSTDSATDVAGNVMVPGDMASIDAAIDAASTSALIATMASGDGSTAASSSPAIAISTTTQFTDNTGVMAYVKKTYADEPILIDIARCESSFRQYDAATGGILHGKANTDDIGVMQINEKYQLNEALSMGYDIDTVEGNVAYAQYLYDTQGAAPWKASESCWSVAYNNSQSAQALALAENK